MPNLARNAVSEWVRTAGRVDPALDDQPLLPAEEKPEVEAALVRLGTALDAALDRDPVLLSTALREPPLRDGLQTLMGQIGNARITRLLSWIIDADLPDTDAIMSALMMADASGNGQFLQAAMTYEVKPPLLERLYAPERLATLLAAIKPLTMPIEVV